MLAKYGPRSEEFVSGRCSAMRQGQHTVGNFEAKQTNEEKRGNIGEIIALELQVLVDSHDGGILVS